MVLTNAERCAKYRTENQEKYKLVAAMQQFKRTKKLASGTPEAEKMRKTNLDNSCAKLHSNGVGTVCHN